MSILSDKPWQEVQRTPAVDGQCQAWSYSWFFGTERCENPATTILRTACVHEHVRESAQCAGCTKGMTSQPMFCNFCTDGAESHECPVLMTEVPA